MTLPFALATFFTMWWIVLFAVLPFGIRSQHEEDSFVKGTEPGAPVRPMLLQKALWTTGITAILFAGLYLYMTH